MRKLQFRDTFTFARILKKVNIKDVINNANNELKDENADKQEVFLNVFLSIINDSSDPAVEAEIYELLGNVTEKGPKEISESSLDEIVNDFKTIAEENNLKSFFKQAMKAMK